MSAASYADAVSHHVWLQANEALKNGMGMEAFMKWASGYISKAGIEGELACNIAVNGWTKAYNDFREDEIEKLN